ncbi:MULTISPECIES: hypothetical protein [unclassified Nostoc]|uniref:hypothetical protein n=1 Tax=unclassified Nostoc TaxID=2593658 RepID=UPI002AD31ED1|nr:hypothetical protein [Nostoc sp. DedQUE03]MDZ7975771.1 hypothetical protein [Nostoc sp. DedQUE03]MDZ8048304.1 hypothetical protein [Nostoc sp. DedQUE02]
MYIRHLNRKQVSSLINLLLSDDSSCELPEYLIEYCSSLEGNERLKFQQEVIDFQAETDRHYFAELRFSTWLTQERLAMQRLLGV